MHVHVCEQLHCRRRRMGRGVREVRAECAGWMRGMSAHVELARGAMHILVREGNKVVERAVPAQGVAG